MRIPLVLSRLRSSRRGFLLWKGGKRLFAPLEGFYIILYHFLFFMYFVEAQTAVIRSVKGIPAWIFRYLFHFSSFYFPLFRSTTCFTLLLFIFLFFFFFLFLVVMYCNSVNILLIERRGALAPRFLLQKISESWNIWKLKGSKKSECFLTWLIIWV